MIEDLIIKIKTSGLSKEDESTISMCQKCKWLKRIDYKRLKIYCNLPCCKKEAEKIEARI